MQETHRVTENLLGGILSGGIFGGPKAAPTPGMSEEQSEVKSTIVKENLSPVRSKTSKKLAMIPELPSDSPNQRLKTQNTDNSLITERAADYGDMTTKSTNKRAKHTKKHARNLSQIFENKDSAALPLHKQLTLQQKGTGTTNSVASPISRMMTLLETSGLNAANVQDLPVARRPTMTD